jgi:hypothetical protein
MASHVDNVMKLAILPQNFFLGGRRLGKKKGKKVP